MDYGNFLKNQLSDRPVDYGSIVKEAVDQSVRAVHRRNQIFWQSYDGEKNSGELGFIKKYFNDYDALRARSWQLYKESDVAQIIVERALTWVISVGLKLQSEPMKKILEMNGIKVNAEEFSEVVEAKFSLWANSSISDYSSRRSLNKLSKEAYKNIRLGGDMLVICRVRKGRLTVQLVDGAHVKNPVHKNQTALLMNSKGVITKNGIEQNAKGEHLAYWIFDRDGKYKRIKAKSPDGRFKQAFMVYGKEERLDENRGVPALAVLMESIKKMDRYKDATVGAAEELAKLVYFITHQEFSTGETPHLNQLAAGLGLQEENAELDDGSSAANKIAATTGKQVYNMPVGADIKTLDRKGEMTFPDFFNTNVQVVCAAFGIPPEVALMLYGSNFSASRAALKDWEHSIDVARADFSEQFYKPIYEYWLGIEAMKGRIRFTEYLEPLIMNDFEIRSAFQNARFTGPNVPHIDPKKEVDAVRAKLGPLGANIPLTTAERATEEVNGGEFQSNQEQFKREVKDFEVNEENS